MPETPLFPHPQDNRRPRFRSRAGHLELTSTEDSFAHQPPSLSTRLSLPESEPSATPDISPETGQSLPDRLTLGPELDHGNFPRNVPEDEKPLAREPQIPYWARPSRPKRSNPWWLVLGGVALTAAGFIAGNISRNFLAPGGLTGGLQPPEAAPRTVQVISNAENLTSTSQAALDSAFSLMQSEKPQDGRAAFEELLKKHPAWPQLALEEARAAFYQGDEIGAKSILDKAENAGLIGPADAAFMGGMFQMSAGNFPGASISFEHAASWDPTRDDVYYFWGECLRRVGKPAEAATRLRSALLRNQREEVAGIYQLKLWLAEIQGNMDVASGASARIDAELAMPHPSGYALAAAAARSVRAEHPAAAVDFLRRASETLDAPIYRIVLHDALFMQEAYLPDFAPLYAPKPPGPG